MGKEREIELIARGVCIRDGKVLACQNVKGGYYYLPGGHIEFGESAAVTVERELKEECGLDFAAGDCVLVSENRFSTRGRQHHEVNLVFHVEPTHPTEGIRSAEADIAFDWLDLAALVDVDLRPESIKAWLVAGGQSIKECSWIPMDRGA